MQSMLIILISGDVQLNPGPKTRLPCGICRKNVNKNQKAMECETCLKWYHNKCTGMKDALYHIHMEHESFVWICSKCGMPNLSNSTLSLDRVNTSNSFDVLINLDLESSKECVTSLELNSHRVGNPKHTSSPKKSNSFGKNKRSERKPKATQRKLKLMNVNFQSVRNKIPLFQALVEKEKPDVIFGTETWLDETVFSNEILPPTYQLFRKDRKTNTTGGGVLLAIRDDLISKEEPNLCSQSCETLWATIHMKGSRATYFGVVYRPDSGNTKKDQQCIEELSQILHKIPPNSHIWVSGDFNLPDVDWAKKLLRTGRQVSGSY